MSRSEAPSPGTFSRRLSSRIHSAVRFYRILTRALHRTALTVVAHDCLNIAQSTAYSAIVALFPALIVAAALISLLPDTAPVRYQLADFFDRVLPPGVSPLLEMAFETPQHTHSIRALVSAIVVSFAGASNVIATLMEGFRRAREMPETWTFWGRRRRAFQLVPLSLAPFCLASVLVVFGHAAASWIVSNLGPEVRNPIYTITLLIRWGLALGTSVVVVSLLYQLGVPDPPAVAGDVDRSGRTNRRRFLHMRPAISFVPPWLQLSKSWRATLPGAVMATAMWFLTTLAFGWYVTRFTNYSEVYGSLAAGIALLFWLYIISLSVLCGAEFNAQFAIQHQAELHNREIVPQQTTPEPLASEPQASQPAEN